MFGIRFAGHPDLRRLLIYEEFVGPPAAQGLSDRSPAAADRPASSSEDSHLMAERTTRELFARGGDRGRHPSGDGSQHLFVNLGPAHPAMHGIIRIFAELDGEIVVKTDVEIGYLHRGLREGLRGRALQQRHPVHGPAQLRLAAINNFGYCVGGREAPRHRRHRALQVHPGDHERDLPDLRPPHVRRAPSAMELGAFTVFLYMIKAREYLWELVEDVTGARLTISYGRVGGVKADLPAGFDLKVKKAFGETRQVLEEVHTLVTGNRIFMDRMVGVGALSREETIAWAITGPAPARRRRRLRRAQGPAVLGLRPDAVRGPAREERRQLRPLPRPHGRDGAVHAHRRAGARGPARRLHPGGLGGPRHRPRALRRPRQAGQDRGAAPGPDHSSRRTSRARTAPRTGASTSRDKRVVLPPKETAYGSIEGLMNHFMLVMDGYGIRPPAGEAYFAGGGRQRRAGLLRGLGRDRPPVSRALPAAVPAAGRGAAPHDRGPDGRRHHPHLRLRQHDRRRAGSIDSGAEPRPTSRRRGARRGDDQSMTPVHRPSSSPRCGASRASTPTSAGALLPVLHLAQDAFGYVSLEVEEYVAGPLRPVARPRARGRHLLHAVLPAARRAATWSRSATTSPVTCWGRRASSSTSERHARHRGRRDHAGREGDPPRRRVPVRVRGGAHDAGGRPLRGAADPDKVDRILAGLA